MMRSTLGAPLGGTTRGGHQGLESLALSLITPPNFGGGGGICFPSIVVVALGEPSVPVSCCAAAFPLAKRLAMANAPKVSFRKPAPKSILRLLTANFGLTSVGRVATGRSVAYNPSVIPSMLRPKGGAPEHAPPRHHRVTV